MAFAMAVPMALYLLRRPHIAVPRGFVLWLVFLVWVVGGVFVLQVNAPFAVAGPSTARYITWAYRLGWYLVATIALLYVGNNRSLSGTKICRIMGWMFITVTLGGLAGALFTSVDFPSALELLLPRSVAHQTFIHEIIHPQLAQTQEVLGYVAPRPSAPFPFSNIWGLNFVCLAPFFVRGWIGRDAGWRRYVAPFVLLAALVPVIYSVNRGMWLALVAMGLFLAVRSTLFGRPAILLGIFAGTAVALALVAASPLGGVVSQRLSGAHHTSNQGRTNLGLTTIESVAGMAPVTGYGTTRHVQGNFNSIAGGESALCPRCSPPSLGTQGQLSLVTFSQGFVGAAVFVGFFLVIFLRYIRARSPSTGVALAVLLASFVTMPVYNSLGVGLVAIMIATALLWRENTPAVDDPDRAQLPTLERHMSVVTRSLVIVLACAAAGLSGGVAWQLHSGVPVRATTEVWLAPEVKAVQASQGQLAIDTLAQLVHSRPVIAAARHVSGSGHPAASLSVQATPLTRILQLIYTARDGSTAGRAVRAARAAYVDEYHAFEMGRQKAATAQLAAQVSVSKSAVEANSLAIGQVRRNLSDPQMQNVLTELQQTQTEQTRQLAELKQKLHAVALASGTTAHVVQPVRLEVARDVWRVTLTTGLLLGALVGVVIAWLRAKRGPVLRRPDDVPRLTGLPVLAQIRGGSPAGIDDATTAATELAAYHPEACLAVDTDDPAARALADQLDVACRRTEPSEPDSLEPPRVLVIVGPRTRVRGLDRRVHQVRRMGAHVVGAVFLERSAPRRSGPRPSTRRQRLGYDGASTRLL